MEAMMNKMLQRMTDKVVCACVCVALFAYVLNL